MTGFNSKRQMAQDKEALAQPVQEPVDNDFFKVLARNNPSPDQRPWVGLTDEQQIAEALRQHGLTSVRPGADAHQRYKSKGT